MAAAGHARDPAGLIWAESLEWPLRPGPSRRGWGVTLFPKANPLSFPSKTAAAVTI